MKKLLHLIATTLFIVSCGGGGGGGTTPTPPTTPAPTVNLSADPISVLLENTSTLTWSSTNATSCSASWTTQTGSSGSEAVTISTAGNNSFSISCTGAGGSRSASVTVEGYRNTDGVVVDGYISGAEVCIDEDESWTCDSSESSTTSDNDGKFTIKYANGNLVSIGGTDLDSQTLLDNLLITHKLTGHSDFKAVTPVTSIAAFMTDASLVNAALGIDASIDVFTFDPVANKGDGGINDYLYEKGNQLTVLAFALQNITNDLNTTTETTQDYFKAITEEIEKEYTETSTKVDIETEAFITKVLNNVIAAKTLTISDDAKANTAKALSGVMPIIEVKSSDDLTTSVIRFAVSTLQTDIQAIANGTASEETVASYSIDVLTYIAEDQNIEADEITPDITAIADSATTSEDTSVTINVVLNDSYLTSAPISVSAGNGSNGTTTLAESSPEQIVYSPNSDFNGTDTFTYTITQGDKTSSADVTVTIEAVNDAPSIDTASTIQVAENQTAVTTISVSDVDEDDLTLTLSGTDADSFDLSTDNVLTFKEAPDFETKSSYSITLSLTDGTETVDKDISIVITDVNEFGIDGRAAKGVIGGGTISVVDSAGADVAIASGGTTNADGSYTIIFDQAEVSAPIVVTVAGGDGATMVCDIDLAGTDDDCAVDDGTSVAFGESYPLPGTFALRGLVVDISTEDGASETVYITPASDLATNLALASADTNPLTAADVKAASSQVLGLIQTITGIDLSGQDLNDIAIPDIADSADAAAASESSLALAAFSAAIIANQGDGETVGDVIARVNASLSANAEGNLVGSGTELSSLANSVVTALTTVSAQVTAGGGDSSAVDASIDTAEAIEEVYEAIGSEDISIPSIDNIAPVIKVNGDNPVTIELGSTYIDAGATADGGEIVITSGTIPYISGTFVTSTVGSYTLTYSATDIDGNTGTTTRAVNIVDTTAPVVTVTSGTDTVELGTTWTDAGATATDLSGSVTVVTTGTVDTDTVGTYTVTYTSTDASGNAGTATRTVTVTDTTKPVVTVTSGTDTVELGTTWTDAGATATDLSGTVTVVTTGTVDTDTVGSYTVTYTSTDASGNAGTATRTVTVTDTTGPVFTSNASFTAAENQTSIGPVTANDPAGAVTFVVSGSELAITTSGVLTFISAPDFETKKSYTATVTASDGTNSTTQAITVNVTNVNDNSPVFTSLASFSANENQTAIDTVTATDADGDSVTFTVSGSELAITSAGVLTFASAPDYETKATYTATLTASDGTNSTTQDMTVSVTNVNEAPVINNIQSSLSAEENQLSVYQVNAVDYEGNTIYYSITGTDKSFFDISASGLITFKIAPDFESPADSGSNNSYSININVSDVQASSDSNLINLSPKLEQTSDSTEVIVTNVDEDLINLVFSTTDGSSAEVPTMSIDLKIDELTQASEVQVLTWLVNNTQTWHTATKVDSLNWSILKDLDRTTASGTYEIRKVLIKRSGLDDLTIVDTALIEKGFDIDSLIYNTGSDSTDPILSGVDSITVSGNDDNSSTNIVVTIIASVNDGIGEIDKVFSYIKGPGGETVGAWGVLNDAKSKVTFEFNLEPRTGSGTYTIDDIRLYDVAGNQSFYTNSDLVTAGFTNSWNIANSIADSTAPNITALNLAPSINASDLNRKQITINLTTDSQTTDINDIYIRIISPDSANIDQYIVDTGRLFTTTQDGNNYSHTISLPLEYPDGVYNISYIFINDKALNNKQYQVAELNSLGFNTNVVFGSGNDHSPAISSPATYSAAENQTSIGTVTATDADGDSVTFTVSGSELAITSAGVLTFASAPDYETKSTYTATVTASDGTNTSTQAITVNVTDVNEAPAFTSSATFSAAENQTAIDTVTATDADGDSVTFTVSGSELQITSAGVLTFASAPDYETKPTYTATVTATDGINLSTQNITVTITNVLDSFKGEVIDGYISGAEIFIDQNFNFNMDDGEYSATTSSDGSFTINIGDEDVYKCLEKRPIIANVPVGAIDSSLGEVSQAYQMVLPSISDTGNTSIVISPFTSLFAEAILSSKSNIAQDLTVSEGCESNGDNIAANISTRIDELKASIESNFGISYDQLLSDFIENPTDDVDETSAQNIAKLLPYLQIIDNQVSDYLTESFDKNIRANVSLSEDSLSTIFGGSNYEKLPLDFYSNYQTSPNSDGWYRSESLDASGAFISKDGVLSREDCSEADTTLCDITELSLNNIANTSTFYTKTSSFSKSTPVDFNELGITNGSLSVSSTISSSWRNNSENWNQSNSRSRECQKTESINFSTGNTDTDKYTTQFHYNNYSQGFEKADCNDVRHYYTPILNASTFLSDGSGSSLGAQYYIFDVLRSGISSNLPYNFVDDSVNINPELVVKDIAVLPRMYKDLDTIRALFRGDDYILFNYDRNSALAGYFEAGTNPSNDMFWDRETESSRIYGQAARTAFFNKLKEDPNLNEDFYGESAPTNTSVIGRIANSYIEITDFNGSDEITLQVTPTYDYQTQTLDYSVESSLDLDNIKDFIRNGINGNPLNAKIWYNPDGSIESTVPIKLYLYEGDDASIDANEGYFEMSFNLNVSSSSSGNTNNYEATQVWTIEENSEISVSYSEDGVTISQTVTNIDEDKITLVDSNTGDTADSLDSYITQPSNLNLKLLNLISKVSDKISGIQNFFEDGGKYTIELDLGSGGHSLVAFDRNIVKNITGTFTTKSSPTYAISVNDMIINEGDSKNICFSRSSNGDLSATEFDLSFTQRERPGKGGLADDFTLSDTTIVFDENATQSCIVFSAIKDTHFDWAHDIYLDISEPSNGQSISRSRIKITILDIYFPNRIDWRRK